MPLTPAFPASASPSYLSGLPHIWSVLIRTRMLGLGRVGEKGVVEEDDDDEEMVIRVM